MKLDDFTQIQINNAPLILQLIQDRKKMRKQLVEQADKLSRLQRMVDVLHNDLRKWMIDTQYVKEGEE